MTCTLSKLPCALLAASVLVLAWAPPSDGVVSTNVSFNTSYFARQSTEGHELDESALTDVERMRLERMRARAAARSLPAEELSTYGDEPGEGGGAATALSPSAEESVALPRDSFEWKAEYAVLIALGLMAIGVLLFGGKRKK